jgi:hypothetical protein
VKIINTTKDPEAFTAGQSGFNNLSIIIRFINILTFYHGGFK